MAKMIGGPFGLLSGKLGNRIYYIVDGQQRSRAAGKVTKPATPRQVANRLAMKAVFLFVRNVRPFIDMGFAPVTSAGKQPRFEAMAYIRKYAMTGTELDRKIDFGKVLLSMGRLRALTNVSVSIHTDTTEGISLKFEWEVELEDRDWPRCNDQTMLMVFCPELNEADERACFKLSGARRTAGEDTLLLPAAFAGKSIEVYISVISDDRKETANSQHLGQWDLS